MTLTPSSSSTPRSASAQKTGVDAVAVVETMPVRSSNTVRAGAVLEKHCKSHGKCAGKSPRKSPGKSPGKKALVENEVTIHVCDDARGVKRDFRCGKEALVRHMSYFASYLQDLDKLDISVHCDVQVFAWLMDYVRAPEQASLDVHSVVSILIASDFLGMEPLVRKALSFIAGHLREVQALPIDLACLRAPLLDRLAAEVPLCDLDCALPLHRSRLEQLLRRPLALCADCGRLFAPDRALPCAAAPGRVDFRGRLDRTHRATLDWDAVRDLVAPLRRRGMPWSTLFWGVWAVGEEFRCRTCGVHYDGTEGLACAFHPSRHCCSTPRGAAGVFSGRATGCKLRAHVADESFSATENLQILQRRMNSLAALQEAVRRLSSKHADQGAGAPLQVLGAASAWVDGPGAAAPAAAVARTEDWVLERQRDEDALNMRRLELRLHALRGGAAQ